VHLSRLHIEQDGGGVAGAAEPHLLTAATGLTGEERDEQARVPHRRIEDGLHEREGLGTRVAGERERPPGDAHGDADAGLLGAVAGHVADDEGDLAVGEAHAVVEVAAEQEPIVAGR
jgi:hypothetical protein